MENLLNNPDFTELILGKIMGSDIQQLLMREGSSDGAMKAVDACKFFNDKFYDIISQGKIAEGKDR